jgi:hypothetical protein
VTQYNLKLEKSSLEKLIDGYTNKEIKVGAFTIGIINSAELRNNQIIVTGTLYDGSVISAVILDNVNME